MRNETIKNIYAYSGNLEIRVDRRTELLGIIEIISNYKKKYPNLLEVHGNKEYIEGIEKTFNKYRDYKVIQLFNKIILNNNFSYDAPICIFLELDDNFTFNKLNDYPFKDRLNCDTDILEMLKLLPSFAKEINFDKFYINNKKRYEKYINYVKKELDDKKFIEFLLNYYNINKENIFVVNLIPFQSKFNYGTKHENIIYASISGNYNSKNEEELFSLYPNIYLLYHEFSHSFINPLTYKYNIIKEDNPIFNGIKDKMKSIKYVDNCTILNEHIIRALTARAILLIEKDEDWYKRRIEKEKSLGFIYIENIIESLIYYENNRDKYKNIDEYYPIIIENMSVGWIIV